MPQRRPVHWNTPADDGKTKCGLDLRNVAWSRDPSEAECGNCQKGIAADKRKGKA